MERNETDGARSRSCVPGRAKNYEHHFSSLNFRVFARQRRVHFSLLITTEDFVENENKQLMQLPSTSLHIYEYFSECDHDQESSSSS